MSGGTPPPPRIPESVADANGLANHGFSLQTLHIRVNFGRGADMGHGTHTYQCD